MTGERPGRVAGIELRAPRRLPPRTLRSTGPPVGLAAAIGASRPSRASVSVPRV